MRNEVTTVQEGNSSLSVTQTGSDNSLDSTIRNGGQGFRILQTGSGMDIRVIQTPGR